MPDELVITLKLPPQARRIVRVLLALAFAAALGFGYYELLTAELTGYRLTREAQLRRNELRDARRRLIAGVPATRDRMLKEEFGNLPETGDIRTEMRLVNVWRRLAVGLFTAIAAAASCYVAFWPGKSFRRRLLCALAVLIAASQVLPLLIFPEDALRLIRRVGGPAIGVAALYLVLDALWDRVAARRRAAREEPAP